MLKLAFWGILAFIVYRYFLKPNLLGQKQDVLDDDEFIHVKIPKKKSSKKPKDNDEDYIDYHEVK